MNIFGIFDWFGLLFERSMDRAALRWAMKMKDRAEARGYNADDLEQHLQLTDESGDLPEIAESKPSRGRRKAG